MMHSNTFDIILTVTHMQEKKNTKTLHLVQFLTTAILTTYILLHLHDRQPDHEHSPHYNTTVGNTKHLSNAHAWC